MDFSFNVNSKIYIAGHNGLIGSAFLRYFKNNNYNNIIYQNRDELDLFSRKDTYNFFKKHSPDVVILAAGKVGGIIQNRDFPADFINENLSIQLNVIGAANKFQVNKLLFFGSSCIYPKETNQPMKESQLWTGYLEETSIAYATAKYAGIQMCKSMNKQNGSVSFIPVIPNSAYGPNDNFDLNSSHVLSALIRRIHEAKEKNSSEVILWGSGLPKREFIFVDDIVNASIKIINSKLNDEMLPINIGVGVDISIKDLAKKISKIIGYSGKILWDKSKPDGAVRKLLDDSKIKSLGWVNEVDLDQGISITYEWYLDNIR
jgi:GDP-L-fucose synthase